MYHEEVSILFIYFATRAEHKYKMQLQIQNKN